MTTAPPPRLPGLPRWTFQLPRGRFLSTGKRPLVMGVVNVTPDSFSDGGVFLHADAAVHHGLTLLAEGADLLDLGAESTRPGGGVYGAGAAPVSVGEELDRLLPVLERLRRATEAPLAVDTRKAAVAAAALGAGADLINDVSAFGDPAMGPLTAAAGVPVVLMHSRGELATMQRAISFHDVVAEVAAELAAAAARAEEYGLAAEQILVDPGLGFGKDAAQNLQLMAHLPTVAGGRPLLVGASRKSFLGAISNAPPQDRLEGSLAAAAWAASAGAAMVRVHDVRATVRFLDAWAAIREAGGAP